MTVDLQELGPTPVRQQRADDIGRLAASNRLAFERALDLVRAAGGGTIILPDGDHPISAPIPDTASRRREARYAIRVSDCKNVRIVSRSGRSKLVRLESEASTGADMDATLAIIRSTGITIEGIELEGHQDGDPKNGTTGNNISLLFGSREITIQDVTTNKGTNGVAIGDNRTVGSPRYTDLRAPVRDVQINRMSIYNGEHAILMNVAEGITVAQVKHTTRPYEYRGQVQEEYIQRGLYLLACRKISVSKCVFDKAHKTSILCAVYPSSRTYSDLEDIRLDDIAVSSSCPLDADYHIGLQFLDHNNDPMHLRRFKNIKVRNLHTKSVRVAVHFRETGGDAAGTERVMSDLAIEDSDLRGTTHGVLGVIRRPPIGLSVIRSQVRVQADNACDQRSPAYGIRMEAVDRTEEASGITEAITISQSSVESDGTALAVKRLSGCNLIDSKFSTTDHSGKWWDASIAECTNVNVRKSQLGNGRLHIDNSPTAKAGWTRP
ncbi:MAG: hypothetical protein JSR89_05045 [Proteobacteria bacterium]|nr:hypothetical protein [Pseudomonadota bacterium]